MHHLAVATLLVSLAACREPAVEPVEPVRAADPLTLAPATRVALSPASVPLDGEASAVRERLFTLVQAHARDPDNPWAVGHALLALGPDLTLDNGEDAVSWLFSEYAEWITVDGREAVRFPVRQGERRVEPHSELVLKTLTEIGVSPGRAVTVQGRPATVADLYSGAVTRAWVDGERTGYQSWNDTPWALRGLAAWAPPGFSWRAGGHDMTLDGFTSATVSRLRGETATLRAAMAAGTTVEKRGQDIFGYTCGGAHLYQGAAYAVARGFGTDADRQAMADEFEVYAWRATVELPQVDALLEAHPEYAVVLLEQRLKFLGHLLETSHQALAMGIASNTPQHRELVVGVRGQLVKTVQALTQMGVLDRLNDVRESSEQTYLDYVGDAAHALHGLDLSSGAAGVRY